MFIIKVARKGKRREKTANFQKSKNRKINLI